MKEQPLIIVVYLNVGNASVYNAEKYCKDVIKTLQDNNSENENIKQIVIPVRDRDTSVECINPSITPPNNYKKIKQKQRLKKATSKIGIEQLKSNLQNKDAETRKFLIEIFNQMKVRTEKDNRGFIYYDVDGLGTVFEQDAKNKKLWISNKHIWLVMESKFGYNYQQAKKLITGTVEDILNWRGYTLMLTDNESLFGWKKY